MRVAIVGSRDARTGEIEWGAIQDSAPVDPRDVVRQQWKNPDNVKWWHRVYNGEFPVVRPED